MNDSFVHFASFRKAIRRIKDPATRLAAYEMLEDYALEGIIPDEDETPVEVLMLFDVVKDSIDENKAGRNSQCYRHFRKSVLERDGYTCKYCGSTKNLHVHHILPYAYYPNERTNPDNGITLCKRCHYEEHRK